jgi:hypothetical protein
MRLAAAASLSLVVPLATAPAGASVAASRAPARDVAAADPLRKVLLDALRPAIERDLGQKKLIFVIRVLRVQGEWAFADVAPRTSAGKPIDFRKTRHAERLRLGMLDDDTVYLLLRRSRGRWKVVTFAVGPTDVSWDGWDEEYGAPRSLFALPSR